MKYLFIAMFQTYRLLTKWKKPSCRFYPTCSQYGIDALRKYGTVKGLCKTMIRIGKCHPYHPGGEDPA